MARSCYARAGGDEKQALLAARDIPEDVPMAEGAIVFQFTLCGGTPAESEYTPTGSDAIFRSGRRSLCGLRLPEPAAGAPARAFGVCRTRGPRVAGPFDDPNDRTSRSPRDRGWRRSSGAAVQTLLRPQPVGLAMRAMSQRFHVGNAGVLASRSGNQGRDPANSPNWLTKSCEPVHGRSDTQKYLVLGDPAVYPADVGRRRDFVWGRDQRSGQAACGSSARIT